MERRLYRNIYNKIIAGVCSGLADYFNIDPVLIRVIFVISAIISGGLAIFGYIVFWIIVPVNLVEPVMDKSQPADVSPSFTNINVNNKIQKKKNGRVIFGIMLIIMGVFFLLNRIFPALELHFWPILLIILGVLILLKGYMKSSQEQQ
ncbi:MAG: PspC domain-containing protein [Candidatus Kapabacteria bacterium]|nr:PspC domain-containing protein [Candidatus Kapabacteria bacterium]